MSLSGMVEAGRGDLPTRAAQLAAGDGRAGGRVVAAKAVAGNAGEAIKQVQLPIRINLKRPQKSRVEIEFAGQTAIQMFDGTHGWKLRPYLNRKEYEPFTAAEASAGIQRADLEGPLLDYVANGGSVALEAVEPVEGRGAYRLKLTTKNGAVQHIWIDAQSFLDVKVEAAPRRMDGSLHKVAVFQRDFRSVQGVLIPFVLETSVEGYTGTHKLMLEKVAVNPVLDDALFVRPKG
jgi:hypothetical protein